MFTNIGSSTDGWFWGHSDQAPLAPERLANNRRTIAAVAPTAATRARALEVAAALRAGNKPEARRLTVEWVLSRFRPALTLTHDDIADMEWVQQVTLPGWRWLSPVHGVAVPAARARLATKLGGSSELHHHALASLGLAAVLERIAEPSWAAAARAATGAPYNILRAFCDAPPAETFRVTSRETTLGGLLPKPVPAGTMLILKLKHAEYRDHRFLNCNGQVLITEFAKAVAEAVHPGIAIASAVPSPAPLYPVLAPVFAAPGVDAPAAAAAAAGGATVTA